MTEVNDGEMLDVECKVERVYPVGDMEFQLMSGDTAVSVRGSADSTDVNVDGTFVVTKVFSVEFGRLYSSTEDGLTCKVYHARSDSQSDTLTGVTVRCKLF